MISAFYDDFTSDGKLIFPSRVRRSLENLAFLSPSVATFPPSILLHAFFSPLSLHSTPSNPLDARSFATALFAFNVIFTTLVYIPPAAWRSQRTINYRTRTRHYRYTYSSRERVPPFLSLSRFVHPQRVSISIPESVRAEINYPRIHEDSSLRPMKYSRHDDTARLVSPGQGSRGPWVEKKSGLEVGNWVAYRYYSSVLLGCNLPSGALVRSFGPGSIQAHWIPIKSRTRG